MRTRLYAALANVLAAAIFMPFFMQAKARHREFAIFWLILPLGWMNGQSATSLEDASVIKATTVALYLLVSFVGIIHAFVRPPPRTPELRLYNRRHRRDGGSSDPAKAESSGKRKLSGWAVNIGAGLIGLPWFVQVVRRHWWWALGVWLIIPCLVLLSVLLPTRIVGLPVWGLFPAILWSIGGGIYIMVWFAGILNALLCSAREDPCSLGKEQTRCDGRSTLAVEEP